MRRRGDSTGLRLLITTIVLLALAGCTWELRDDRPPEVAEATREARAAEQAAAIEVIEIEAEQAHCVIAGNIARSGEKIFHAPGMRDYHRVRIDLERGEAWFCTEEEAVEAGWRKAQQ
jgi:hypothetical protein